MFTNRIILTAKPGKCTLWDAITHAMKCKQFFTKQSSSFFSDHEINMSLFWLENFHKVVFFGEGFTYSINYLITELVKYVLLPSYFFLFHKKDAVKFPLNWRYKVRIHHFVIIKKIFLFFQCLETKSIILTKELQ